MPTAELLLPFCAEAKKTIKSASGETAMFPFCLKQQQNVLLKAIKTTKKEIDILERDFPDSQTSEVFCLTVLLLRLTNTISSDMWVNKTVLVILLMSSGEL